MRLFVAAAVLLAVLAPAGAQTVPDASPEALVRFIYSQYVGKKPTDDITFRWTAKPMADRLFEPRLAAAVVKAGKSEDLVIDADPFIDGQDFEIAAYDLKVEQQGADSARIAASFKNLGEQKVVRYDLVRLKSGAWRIHDVWSRGPGQGLRRTVKLK